MTPRELDIVTGYAQGLTARNIGAKLGITERTVYTLTTRMAKRLGVQGARQAALVDYAYQQGYLNMTRRRVVPPLPRRLAEVLDCAARGLGLKETAAELSLSLRTVSRHRDRLHHWLGAHSTAHAVAVAWQTGLRDHARDKRPPKEHTMNPRPEARAAAQWWANKLNQNPTHDLGRGAETSTDLVNTTFKLAPHPQHTQAVIDGFRDALAEEIEKHIDNNGWRPDNPGFGSYTRTVAVDYGPDTVITDAAEKAGLHLRPLELPLKTVMWINPGIVSVAEGHSAQPVTIWSTSS